MRSFGRTAAGLAAALSISLAGGATSAAAAKTADEAYRAFDKCPIANHSVGICIVATTTSGEFVMGGKTVKIEEPVIMQGGLAGKLAEPAGVHELVPPTSGPLLASPPMKVPGGLTGIPGVGPEVTATTELVGPVMVNLGNLEGEMGIAATLPLRVKLDSSGLGSECFVGSAAEPILLNLTTGTTSPPPPNTPISGSSGHLTNSTLLISKQIASVEGVSLVDNSFSAPEAHGCGEGLSIDPLVNLSAGLPSAGGKNTAILNGSALQTTAKRVKKSHVEAKPKK